MNVNRVSLNGDLSAGSNRLSASTSVTIITFIIVCNEANHGFNRMLKTRRKKLSGSQLTKLNEK